MKAIFKIIRPLNLLMIAVVMLMMQYMIAIPILSPKLALPAWILCLLIMGVVFIAAGGYAINDYFDVKIDMINRPDKVIVTRDMSKHQAMLIHQVFTTIGVVLGLVSAYLLRNLSIALIYVLIPGLLWFYSSAYKRQFVIGNLIVSFATALVPLIIALANIAYIRHIGFGFLLVNQDLHWGQSLYAWIGGFALFAFLTTWIREILKDMQDQAGDRELECHTLPIRIGNMGTKIVLTVLFIITCALVCYAVWEWMPGSHQWKDISVRYAVCGVLIPLLCNLIMVWTAKIASDYKRAQYFMKFIMLLGVLYSLVVFTLLR